MLSSDEMVTYSSANQIRAILKCEKTTTPMDIAHRLLFLVLFSFVCLFVCLFVFNFGLCILRMIYCLPGHPRDIISGKMQKEILSSLQKNSLTSFYSFSCAIKGPKKFSIFFFFFLFKSFIEV